MNNINSFIRLYPVFFILSFLASCNGQNNKYLSEDRLSKLTTTSADTSARENQQSPQDYVDPFKDLNMEAQIMQVLRRVFRDSRDNLWFVGDGVFCFDGDSLVDLSEQEVFRRNVVRQIKEDQAGSLWFGTHNGIVKYNPSDKLRAGSGSFTSFTMKEGLIDNDVWSMAIDKKGIIWIGTLGGVSRFDGHSFSTFDIPETEPDQTRGVTSARVVHSIIEDSKGIMWFGTNGGAFIYDPISNELSNISEREGLCNNVVNDLLEDKNGSIWFATHHNGVCRWDGTTFTHLTTEDGIQGIEAWSLYEDRSGNIWFPIENSGVYRYDPSSDKSINYHKKDGLLLNAIHTVVEDKNGLFWLGGFGGLYRYDPSAYQTDGKSFINITRNGPWGH